MALLKSPFNPQKWYWKVAGSTTQVWSSATSAYIPVSDATYQLWAAHNTPSNIDSQASLVAVMLAQTEPFFLAKGVAVTSTGTPALNATYALDSKTWSRINTINSMINASKGLPGGGGTFLYPDITGVQHTFSATNFQNLTAALSTYIYNWEEAMITKVTGGTASFPVPPLVIA